MCFAPQRRALFRHRNFQKWSEHMVLLTFWLRNVLRATTACTFSTSQLPKVLRTWSAFSFFTCKCASRHNGVPLFEGQPGLERLPCSVHPCLQLLLPRSWPACCLSARWAAWNFHCSTVQKVTLDHCGLWPGTFTRASKTSLQLPLPQPGRFLKVNCGLWHSPGPQKPPSAAFATFLACLLPTCSLGLKLSFFYCSENGVRE